MDMKVSAVLNGVADFQRAVELSNKRTRDNTIAAVRNGANAVTQGAKARVSKKSGELAETIRPEFKKDGMTAYVKAGYGVLVRTTASKAMGAASRARAIARRDRLKTRLAGAKTSRQALSALDLGVYAPVVERGDKRRKKPARPYLIPALRSERPTIEQELKNAPLKAAKESGMV